MSSEKRPHSEVIIDGNVASLEIGVLTRTDFVRFAGAGGDFNPVHHDEVFAQSLGFPSVFAMGMLTASLASRLLDGWFGLAQLRCYSVRFLASVWPGESLSVRGQIMHSLSEDPSLARVELSVLNERGEQKVVGEATVSIARPGA